MLCRLREWKFVPNYLLPSCSRNAETPKTQKRVCVWLVVSFLFFFQTIPWRETKKWKNAHSFITFTYIFFQTSDSWWLIFFKEIPNDEFYATKETTNFSTVFFPDVERCLSDPSCNDLLKKCNSCFEDSVKALWTSVTIFEVNPLGEQIESHQARERSLWGGFGF